MVLKNLKLIMAEKGYTTEEVSKLADVSPCVVSKASNGRKCIPKTAHKLAKGLGVSVAELLGED